ncbi:MAG: hypothetical protein HY050_09390 [Actinobacteria bacterium]|nr:hypothetical protein [Actinomycetota bacterium]
MKRSTIIIALAALIGAAIGYSVAPREGVPSIPICFSYHENKSVETFAIPNGTACPSGYKYGRGSVASTTDLILILESVAKNNFKNGTNYGKSVAIKVANE